MGILIKLISLNINVSLNINMSLIIKVHCSQSS